MKTQNSTPTILICAAAAAAAFTTLAGCSGLQSPRATVRHVAVTRQSEQGARVEMTVGLRNPNDTPLPVKTATYTMRVAGSEPFHFTYKPLVTMPRRGDESLKLPAAFALRGGKRGSAAGRPFSLKGQVVYEPPGDVRKLLTNSGVPLPTVHFAARGRLSVDVASSGKGEAPSR